MIKYINIPEQNKCIAVLPNTKYDAINKIARVTGGTKSLCFDPSKYLMSDVYRAVVVCHPDDKYDEDLGMKIAKDKLMRKYYSALDAKIAEFVEDLNKAMFEASWRLTKNSENS